MLICRFVLDLESVIERLNLIMEREQAFETVVKCWAEVVRSIFLGLLPSVTKRQKKAGSSPHCSAL
jgi:hypothetical protein